MYQRLFLCLFTFTLSIYFGTTFAETPDSKKEQIKSVKQMMAILSQPIPKMLRCAQAGYIGYQNALSIAYLYGRPQLKQDPAKGYAWSLVADYQINKTYNRQYIKSQKDGLKHIRRRLTPDQISEGELMAIKFIKKYSKRWPDPPIMEQKLPVECEIDYDNYQ